MLVSSQCRWVTHAADGYCATVPCTDHPIHLRTTHDRDVTLKLTPLSMSSQALVNALMMSNFYPPGTNLTLVGLLDAVSNKSRVTKSTSSPLPAVGVLIHREFVWYAKGHPCGDGDEVPPGQWKCIACVMNVVAMTTATKTSEGLYTC